MCLEYASDDLKNDEDIVIIAVMSNPDSIQFASFDIRDNSESMQKVIELSHKCFKHATPKLKNDKITALKAVEKDGLNLFYVSIQLKKDYDVVLKAAQNNRESAKFSN